MQCLFFYAAHFRCCVLARHIVGAANSKADALLRGKLSLYFSTFPQASPNPSPIPQSLLELALDTSQDWTSPHRRNVLQLIENSVAPTTRCIYRLAQNRYWSFCQLANVTPFPVYFANLLHSWGHEIKAPVGKIVPVSSQAHPDHSCFPEPI